MNRAERVFLFEHATCSKQPIAPAVAVEGLGMFKALYDGFNNPISFYREEDYLDLFVEFLDKSEFALAIAPETDMELFRLTELIEDSGVKNLGSSPRAVRLTSDKWLTYKKLRSLSPRTEIFRGSTSLDFPIVAKPRDGVSCEGIILLKKEEELEKVPEGYIVQEYVEGRHLSACILVGRDVCVLSINTQEISDFEYRGARLPIELTETEELKTAVEKIPGLFGYVGLDFVLKNQIPVIIEINPRPTTPIIGLNRAFNMNISDMIIKNYRGAEIDPPKAKRKIQVVKNRSSKGYVSLDGYSINIIEDHENCNI